MMGFVSLPVMAPSGVRISLATFRVGAWMNISFILQFGLTSFLWSWTPLQDVNRHSDFLDSERADGLSCRVALRDNWLPSWQWTAL